jgi:hypothetical protein
MRLTPNFTQAEFERSSTGIRLGIPNVCPPELLGNMLDTAQHLEIIRAHYDSPMHVTSGYRSLAVNKAVGGSLTSAHMRAHAADCEVEGVTVLGLCKWAAANIKDYDQIIYEFGPEGWMHIGFTNGEPRKQLLRATKELIKGKMKTVYKEGLTG